MVIYDTDMTATFDFKGVVLVGFANTVDGTAAEETTGTTGLSGTGG